MHRNFIQSERHTVPLPKHSSERNWHLLEAGDTLFVGRTLYTKQRYLHLSGLWPMDTGQALGEKVSNSSGRRLWFE